VDELERFLGHVQGCQQAPNILETEFYSALLRCEEPFDSDVVWGVQLPSSRFAGGPF
jgi:hypothetical protein